MSQWGGGKSGKLHNLCVHFNIRKPKYSCNILYIRGFLVTLQDKYKKGGLYVYS